MCFERGGKVACTSEMHVVPGAGGTLIVEYNEVLSLVSTMSKSTKEINKFVVFTWYRNFFWLLAIRINLQN